MRKATSSTMRVEFGMRKLLSAKGIVISVFVFDR